jgi:hypothetical protein
MSDAATPETRDRSGHGVVVIGRNEGERLRAACSRAPARAEACVYVDSGLDRRLRRAGARGWAPRSCKLDMSRRSRRRARATPAFHGCWQLAPGVELVQFVDGDCELLARLDAGAEFLQQHPDVVAVAAGDAGALPGRVGLQPAVRHRMEHAGRARRGVRRRRAVPGRALRAVGGYRDDLIAGEEPELCVRLRAAGGRVWRLDADMTLARRRDDAWSQWWRRNVRSGHAFAEGARCTARRRSAISPARRGAPCVGIACRWILSRRLLVTPWALAAVAGLPAAVAAHRRSLARAGAPIPWTHAASCCRPVSRGAGRAEVLVRAPCRATECLIEYK